MSASEMQDDLNRSLSNISALSSKHLRTRLFELQGSMIPEITKQFKPRCVRVTREEQEGRKVSRYKRVEQGFVAASYPWEAGGSQSVSFDRYVIVKPPNVREIQHPGNPILDRISSFAQAKNLPFWIDKLCIDQSSDGVEKEIAVRSMDEIYKK